MNISGLQFCIFIYSEWKVGGGLSLGGGGSLSLVVDLCTCKWGEGDKGEGRFYLLLGHADILEFLSLCNTIIISGGWYGNGENQSGLSQNYCRTV